MPSLPTPDGRTLFYDVRGKGEPLVCHPGGPGFSGAYLGDLGGLARFRALLALDPRGTGRSDPPGSPDAYALDDYVADLVRVQDQLGIDRMDLLGHSHGSLVALGYAARYPDRIGRLVLIAIGSRFHEEQVEAMHKAMQKRSSEPWFDDASAAIQKEHEGKFHDDAELGRVLARGLPFHFANYGKKERYFVRLALKQSVNAAALCYFNTHEYFTFDVRPILANVTAPTLVVAGEKDFLIDPPVCREIAHGIPDARLETLEGAGHLPWFERPEEFTSAVRTFLSD
jgi:proline iminopeptidase